MWNLGSIIHVKNHWCLSDSQEVGRLGYRYSVFPSATFRSTSGSFSKKRRACRQVFVRQNMCTKTSEYVYKNGRICTKTSYKAVKWQDVWQTQQNTKTEARSDNERKAQPPLHTSIGRQSNGDKRSDTFLFDLPTSVCWIGQNAESTYSYWSRHGRRCLAVPPSEQECVFVTSFECPERQQLWLLGGIGSLTDAMEQGDWKSFSIFREGCRRFGLHEQDSSCRFLSSTNWKIYLRAL